MANLPDDLNSPFTIAELSGDKRTLKLTGRALPYRPFELSGKQRNSIEWYTGNPEGVLQVYGPQEEPTTITGQWKDIFLGEANHNPFASVDDQPIFKTRELAKLVDDMRRKGQTVEVVWLDQVRRGIIDRFTMKWADGHDLEWELAFNWTSQGEETSDVPFLDAVQDIGDAPGKMQGLISKLTGGVAAFNAAFDGQYQPLVDKLDSVGADLQGLTDELNDAVVSVAWAAQQPAVIASRVAGIMSGLNDTASFGYDTIQNSIDGAICNLDSALGPAVRDRAAAREQAVLMLAISSTAAQERRDVLEQLESANVFVYQARADQDLREVSRIYYGTTDHWRGLMRFNKLDTEVLFAGQIIFVPVQPPSDGV